MLVCMHAVQSVCMFVCVCGSGWGEIWVHAVLCVGNVYVCLCFRVGAFDVKVLACVPVPM